ncbi:DeoR/GlpR family DNA-binding transcription regulator [Pedobacter sp. Hv1]|uniref:DeoR/GlpR family DNA-binding transcription regulator n=1 Tax=Pedobacter sp. Hv1 TaxID=1740090 RepID=UPI0006D8CEB4|nr:DeoR/GlpR family DNA-binding transcription regulator [Pedobacter sp. Hv1]KQB99933.1 DeoR family transcriptional regulator [Pedobacter sp. Hv1]
MQKEERFDYILNQLNTKKRVDYKSLAKEIGISEDTIRRDIAMLYKNGLLSKVSGGAVIRSNNPLSFQDRSKHYSAAKDVIAIKAQQFVKKGQTIFMDGGTTICAIAARFPIDASFKVVTNNMALLPILAHHKNIEVTVLGGAYHKDMKTNFGIQTYREVNSYMADVYFMGTCAIDASEGITAGVSEEGEIKRAMLVNAMKTIAISNVEKLNSTFHFRVCDIEQINVLITDLPSNDIRLDDFRNLGIELV